MPAAKVLYPACGKRGAFPAQNRMPWQFVRIPVSRERHRNPPWQFLYSLTFMQCGAAKPALQAFRTGFTENKGGTASPYGNTVPPWVPRLNCLRTL